MTKLRKGMWVTTTALCCLGLAFAGLVLYTKVQLCPHKMKRLVHLITLQKDVADCNTEFGLFMAATGRGRNGTLVDLHIYQSADCVEVRTKFADLHSLKEAEAEFEDTLKTAPKIYERSKQLGADGTVAGERAVAQARSGDYFILQRTGTEVHTTSSESLSYATEFESRRLAPQGTPCH